MTAWKGQVLEKITDLAMMCQGLEKGVEEDQAAMRQLRSELGGRIDQLRTSIGRVSQENAELKTELAALVAGRRAQEATAPTAALTTAPTPTSAPQ